MKCILALLLAVGLVIADLDPVDMNVLLEIYHTLGGDKWTDHSNWSHSSFFGYGFFFSYIGSLVILAQTSGLVCNAMIRTRTWSPWI